MSDITLWRTTGPVSTERVALVEHSETGQRGYRCICWVQGYPQLYGPVYSSPNCCSQEECRLLGIPEREACTILCPND